MNDSIWLKFNYWKEDQQGWAVSAGNANWGWLPSEYNPIARFLTLDGQHIFSPTLIFEGRFVASRWTEGNQPKKAVLDTRNRSLTGATLPQLVKRWRLLLSRATTWSCGENTVQIIAASAWP